MMHPPYRCFLRFLSGTAHPKHSSRQLFFSPGIIFQIGGAHQGSPVVDLHEGAWMGKGRSFCTSKASENQIVMQMVDA